MAERIPKILSLDGGGVRGLSSLLILREIMAEVEKKWVSTETVKPCDVFDLICGTSTGGLIAIMLGLLEMVHRQPIIVSVCADDRPLTNAFIRISSCLKRSSTSIMLFKE